MNNLGAIYEYGGCQLHHNHLQKAAFWYEKAANMNNSGSLIVIGEFYYKGKGVPKSHKVAREWFKKAIDMIGPNSDFWLEANYYLGNMMVEGEGGPTDFVQGITLIHKAASKGLPMAKKLVGDVI